MREGLKITEVIESKNSKKLVCYKCVGKSVESEYSCFIDMYRNGTKIYKYPIRAIARPTIQDCAIYETFEVLNNDVIFELGIKVGDEIVARRGQDIHLNEKQPNKYRKASSN